MKTLQESGVSTCFPSPFLTLHKGRANKSCFVTAGLCYFPSLSQTPLQLHKPTMATEISRRDLPLLVASHGAGGPFL